MLSTMPLDDTRVLDDGAGLASVGPALQLYCDGCYEPRSDTGGWAFLAYRTGTEVAIGQGGLTVTSNTAMELAALLEAARWINANASGEQAIIWSDSAHAVTGCNQWRAVWRNWKWRTKTAGSRERSRPVADADLWKAIDAELTKNPMITVAWCKGHAGLIGNERADLLAEHGRRSAMR